ncbi:MAG: GNAT family N-acetyltransferase [Desulfobacterales bacterium]
MNQNYLVRRAESSEDGAKLGELFAEVFPPPHEVGIFAETIFNCFPGMKREYWFIAEDRKSSQIVSAFALLPWSWEMEGIHLKIAEMGIVGTRQSYRHQGLMRILHKEFAHTVEKEEFDLAIIQGIPGFYHKLGFHYSVPLTGHIHVPLHLMPDEKQKSPYGFRMAGLADIPFLMAEDEKYRKSFSISAVRDEKVWKYMLTDSLKTECGSEFWIMEHSESKEKYVFRIPFQGFGKGLIVSEISESITHEALFSFFAFCRKKAHERAKPYIRLDLHNESATGRFAIAMGAEKGNPYAWQISIPDRIRLLKKMAPILEKRIKTSCFFNFSGILRLDFFDEGIDLQWSQGCLESVAIAGTEECANTFCINPDLFPALCLGHRTWRELQYTRPDIFPQSQYLRPEVSTAADISGLFTDTLFPATKSWIYGQY